MDKFGFIPLQDQALPTSHIPSNTSGSIWLGHARIVDSGVCNYMKMQIPVYSQLNVDGWQKYLEGYWDKQLIYLLKYGFHLNFNHNITFNHELQNHKFANDHPQVIEAYLMEEMKYRAILGPFTASLINNSHVSPMVTRDKPGAKNRHVTVDLSFSQDHSPIHCDNEAEVTILNTDHTRDMTLAAIARNIFMLTAQFDQRLELCISKARKMWLQIFCLDCTRALNTSKIITNNA